MRRRLRPEREPSKLSGRCCELSLLPDGMLDTDRRSR
jgi:hypothetical protein